MSNTKTAAAKSGAKTKVPVKAEINTDVAATENEAVHETMKEAAQPIVQYVAPKDPTVKILYIDSSPDSEIPIGGGRSITGSGRIFNVSLTDFEGTFMTNFVQKLIAKRKFIILSGLDEEQREMYNCNYTEGEIIKNEGMFDKLLNCPTKDAERIFAELCPEHRTFVAQRFITAYENGDNRITRDKVVALNAISKKDYADGTGAFTSIIKAMNEVI